MLFFYLRKFFEFLLTLFLITLITFWAFQILPGNPAQAILGADADEAQIATLERELDLKKSASSRYFAWLKGIFRGDFGKSYKYSEGISKLVFDAATTSFLLAAFSFFLSVVFALFCGVFSAFKEKNPLSILIFVLNQIWISMPSFCAAIFLVAIFCTRLKIFPSMGFVPLSESPALCARSLFLPALSLSLASGAALSRYLKSSIQAELKKDYVRFLRTKGLQSWRVSLHVLKNSLLPAITTAGLLVADILGGSIVIENVFSVPGIGKLLASAIFARDLPLLQTLTLYIAFVTVTCNFFVDVLYSAVDPRIKRKKEK